MNVAGRMRGMQFAICDDDILDREELYKYLKSKNIGSDFFTNGDSMVTEYKEKNCQYDAIFLDIEMPGHNGIEVANAIRELDAWVPIVFVTKHTQYVLESFKCSPFRFLVKPVKNEDLKEVVESLIAKIEKERKVYIFQNMKKIVRVYCDEIVYCESRGHYVDIHTANRTYSVRKTINEMESELDSDNFCRVHRSYLVNMRYVRMLEENKLSFKHDDSYVPVGRLYKQQVVEAMVYYAERELQI